jgi:hypothetical protein
VISSPGSTARPPATLATTKVARPIRYSLALPYASASRPPSSKNPPNATAYALTSHCSVVVAICNPCWIDGRATFTIVKSSTTMNCAIDSVTSNANPARAAPAGACPRPPPSLAVSGLPIGAVRRTQEPGPP